MHELLNRASTYLSDAFDREVNGEAISPTEAEAHDLIRLLLICVEPHAAHIAQ